MNSAQSFATRKGAWLGWARTRSTADWAPAGVPATAPQFALWPKIVFVPGSNEPGTKLTWPNVGLAGAWSRCQPVKARASWVTSTWV